MTATSHETTTVEDVREGDVFVVDGYPDREETALADAVRQGGEVHVPTRTDPPDTAPYDLWFLPPDTRVEIVSRESDQ